MTSFKGLVKRFLTGGHQQAASSKSSHPVPDDERTLSEVFRVVEVNDEADFLIGDMFRRRFNSDSGPPNFPRHFVGFYSPEPGVLMPVGYVHQTWWEECHLCGGLATDNRVVRKMNARHRKMIYEEGGGVAEMLLRASFKQVMPHSKAIWGHVGNPVAEAVDMRVGFRHTGHPHLMVVWNESVVTEEEKPILLEKAKAIGTF